MKTFDHNQIIDSHPEQSLHFFIRIQQQQG